MQKRSSRGRKSPRKTAFPVGCPCWANSPVPSTSYSFEFFSSSLPSGTSGHLGERAHSCPRPRLLLVPRGLARSPKSRGNPAGECDARVLLPRLGLFTCLFLSPPSPSPAPPSSQRPMGQGLFLGFAVRQRQHNEGETNLPQCV